MDAIHYKLSKRWTKMESILGYRGSKNVLLNINLNMYRSICFVVMLILFSHIRAQEISSLGKRPGASFRGLSVVNDRVAWVSGSNGQVGRTTDGGTNWEWLKVTGFEKNDFRDIEAFDEQRALIMSIASPGYILKTIDGGRSWKTVYSDTSRDVFMDAMDFNNSGKGMVIGDPQDGRMYAATTQDRGDTWEKMPASKRPSLLDGEAFFASSGTNIRITGKDAFIASGGKSARFLNDESSTLLPLLQGKQSTGANSIAIWPVLDEVKQIVVVGGDFAADSIATNNCFFSSDGGKTWIPPAVGPHGYRSCVEFIDQNKLIACGTSGVDVSEDRGVHWRIISKESFHVVRKAKNGKLILLAGAGGKLAKLIW